MTIKALQTRLNKAGFSCVADGELTSNTLCALMGYLAGRQPDEALAIRAYALLTYWPVYDAAASPNGWTRLRLIHFLSLCCYETDGWRRMAEQVDYQTADQLLADYPDLVVDAKDAQELVKAGQKAIANRIFADRNGNGDEESGEGWRMRAQGDIPIFGRAAYSVCSEDIGLNLVSHPETIQQPDVALRVALAIWNVNDCNAAADRDDTMSIVTLIKRAEPDDIDQRQALVNKAKAIWPE